jgi:hypothetical protein
VLGTLTLALAVRSQGAGQVKVRLRVCLKAGGHLWGELRVLKKVLGTLKAYSEYGSDLLGTLGVDCESTKRCRAPLR